MQNLHLPSFSYQIQQKGQQYFIFDMIRKKYVLLTPEEWVRQHFIHYLIAENYPKSLFSVEKSHQQHHNLRRTDIVVYGKNGKPFLVVECKSFEVKLNQETLFQVSYYNANLQAPFLAITNGLQHFYFQIDTENQSSILLEKLPSFQ